MARVREAQPEVAAGRAGNARAVTVTRSVQRLAGNHAAARLAHTPGRSGAPPELVASALSETGSALPAGVSRAMGEWFGTDFGAVRVYQGGAAGRAARSVGAQAFTVGEDVVFADGAYDPDADGGQRRLAHELAHVVQQRAGSVDGAQHAGLRVSSPSDPFERHAEQVAEAFGRSARAPAGPGRGGNGTATVQRCGSTPAHECSCHNDDPATVQRQATGGGDTAAAVAHPAAAVPQPAGAGLPRPAGLPLGQGFALYALPQVPARIAGQLMEGQIASISLAQPMPSRKVSQGLEAGGSGAFSGLSGLNQALRVGGLPGSAAGPDAIGLVAIPRTNLSVSPFDPRFNLPDLAAPLDSWGHTAVYVRQGGRIVAVRGFNPSLMRLLGVSGDVKGGAVSVPSVLSEDAYLFTSNAARSLEYPMTAEQAAAFLTELPATGPGGSPGVPPSYTARPAVWAAENPGVAEPFCVASNCGLWAVERVEGAVGGPVGRAGQGTVTAVSRAGPVPGTAGQGQLIGLLDEAAAARAAGTASPLAEVPGAVGPAVAGRAGTALKVIKIGGRVMLVVGIAAGVYEIATAPPERRGRVAAGVAGGFGGGLALGATAGLVCGPGAPVCSVVAGLTLGIIGALGGRAMAEELYDADDRPRDPNAYPGHSIVCPGCHDNAATHADRFRVLAPGASAALPPRPAIRSPVDRSLSAADRAILLKFLQSNGSR